MFLLFISHNQSIDMTCYNCTSIDMTYTTGKMSEGSVFYIMFCVGYMLLFIPCPFGVVDCFLINTNYPLPFLKKIYTQKINWCVVLFSVFFFATFLKSKLIVWSKYFRLPCENDLFCTFPLLTVIYVVVGFVEPVRIFYILEMKL